MTDYEHDVVYDVKLGRGLVYYNIVYKGLPVKEINFFFSPGGSFFIVLCHAYEMQGPRRSLEVGDGVAGQLCCHL